jgi:Tfp pilus assembly protein PilX
MRTLSPSRDEQGIAMVTAILVSAVILTLSITAASLAIHNTDQSGLDRKRLQVVAGAEAGVDAAYASLETTPMT